jgi:predicted dehydrogenase
LLKDSAIMAGVAVGTQAFGVPALLAERSPNSKLGMALIGTNSRGQAHYGAIGSERVVAFVDIDDGRRYGGVKWLEDSKRPKAAEYVDFRKMFDEMADKIDAVFVATPDHTHAVASLAAIRAGKHVYCEKPLTHDIYEARLLGVEARKHKVMTQMGNQGHSWPGIRLLREYLEAGAIGAVSEVHSWQDQRYGTRVRLPSAPLPPGIHWDEWLGPTPKVPYRPDVCPSVGGQNDDTGVGRGWYQLKPYGTGLLLCVGAHVCDPPHWALQLKYPSSCVCLEQAGDDEDSWGSVHRLLFEFPRPNQPTVKFYWYDGYRRRDPNTKGPNAWTLIRPELADELQRKYGEKGKAGYDGGGTLFVGDKGILHCGIFGQNPHIVDPKQHKETPVPEPKYPRIANLPGMFESQADFMRACREGETQPCSNFPDVSGPYIEALLVGNLAMRAGVGRKVLWDGVNMKCTNMPELNQFVKPEYRPGWAL